MNLISPVGEWYQRKPSTQGEIKKVKSFGEFITGKLFYNWELSTLSADGDKPVVWTNTDLSHDLPEHREQWILKS
jgi:hypothetical protein